MDEIDRALLEAWERLAPALRADRVELARRAARRRSATASRPVRAWCLCVRASDRRINRMRCTIEPRRADEHGEPHHVELRGATLRELCKPVRIDWPGVPLSRAARLLGRCNIKNWLRRGVFEVRYEPPGPHGSRGRPVPVVWSRTLLDPNGNFGRGPDWVWGSLWQHLWEHIPNDLSLVLMRTARPRADHRSGGPRHTGWQFTCPGRLTPIPAGMAGATSGPLAELTRLRLVPDEQAPLQHRPVLSDRAVLSVQGRHYLYTPCGRLSDGLYMPVPVWSLPRYLGVNLAPEEGSGADGGEGGGPGDIDLQADLVIRDGGDDPLVRSFACHRCWRVYWGRVREIDCWNAFVTRASGGLLSGREVARPPTAAVVRRRPHRRRRIAVSARRAGVVQGLVEGHSYAQIAAQTGLTPAGVSWHAWALYREHGVHGRCALLAKLGLRDLKPLPPRLAQVCQGLLRGLTTRQIAEHMGIGVEDARLRAKKVYRRYGVEGRTELAARLREDENERRPAGLRLAR